jgi:hypothetical protein
MNWNRFLLALVLVLSASVPAYTTTLVEGACDPTFTATDLGGLVIWDHSCDPSQCVGGECDCLLTAGENGTPAYSCSCPTIPSHPNRMCCRAGLVPNAAGTGFITVIPVGGCPEESTPVCTKGSCIVTGSTCCGVTTYTGECSEI